jgi:DNA-binding LacI/PurR family transcriptional regulator
LKAQTFRYLHVKRQLMRLIETMNAHERLPSRTDLSETFQVARTTIERAISELIGEGWLYARDGSGTYVAERGEAGGGASAAQPGSWGLLIPDIQQYNYPDIVRGVSDVASEANLNLIVCNTDNQTEKQSRHIRNLIDSRVQGVIIVPAVYGKPDDTPFFAMQEAGIPFVFCNRRVEGIDAPSVISNHFHAGYLAARHLAAVGCRRIGYISRPLYSASAERYQGYLSALSEAGLPFRQDWVVFEREFESSGEGYHSARHLLDRKERPDGLFCFNDRIARGVYRAAGELGLRIGRDLRVVSCDNTDICETLPVKLTSVRFQAYEVGVLAARILLGDAEAPQQPVCVLQPELIVRES